MPQPSDDMTASFPGREGVRPPIPAVMPALLGAVLLNGLALAAAFLGVQWGAAPAAAPPVIAWEYVNLSLGATWLVWWPLLRAPEPTEGGGRGGLATQALALAAGALPFLLVAGALRPGPLAGLLPALLAQAALACFVAGALACRGRSAGRAHTLAALLAGLYLFGPPLAYLQAEFAAFWPMGWQGLVPPLLLHRAAGGALVAWPLVSYGLLGGVLFWIGPRRGGSGPARR